MPPHSLFNRAVFLDLSWPSTLTVSHSFSCVPSLPLLSTFPLLLFTAYFFTSYICQKPAIVLGHWDVWDDLYLYIFLFLWIYERARIGFPEIFIAKVVWCFPPSATRPGRLQNLHLDLFFSSNIFCITGHKIVQWVMWKWDGKGNSKPLLKLWILWVTDPRPLQVIFVYFAFHTNMRAICVWSFCCLCSSDLSVCHPLNNVGK